MVAAAVAIGLLWAPAAGAQTQLPTPATACPALFHVLHDDTVGRLVLREGRYRITTFGSRAPSCAAASDLLRQFLEDWDGRLPRPWVVDVGLPGFRRGAGATTGFAVALDPSGSDAGGGGRHPVAGDDCPGLFHVLHDDHVGRLAIEAGWYRITLLGMGRLSCVQAATWLARFLQDFNGVLGGGWRLDPLHATFARGHNVGFRIKEVVADAPRDDVSRTHPAGNRCPATFRVQNNDRIGRLRLRRGSYRITILRGGGVSCAEAADLFAEFLQHPEGRLPRPWVIDRGRAAFRRGRQSNAGFRVKPVRFRARS